MAKRKNMMDMTPVCEWCGKVAPVDTKLSTPNWTVYRTKEPCECGGKYTARAFLDDIVLSSCDKETNHADEYIRRAAALTALQDSDLFNTTERQLRAIRELPAADVAEVVHGQWYMLDDCANAGLYCSACGRRVHHEEFAYKKLKSKYCPHCGARMDGGKDDEAD